MKGAGIPILKRRALLILAVVLAALVLPVAGPEGAQFTLAQGPSLSLEPSSGPPGSIVQASGSGFSNSPCGVNLSFDTVDGPSLAFASVQDGSFSAGIAIPTDATPGEHTVIAQGLLPAEEFCGGPSGEEAMSTFTVIQPAPGPFDFNIYLKNRVVTPPPAIDEAFLEEIRSSLRPTTHAIVQLESLPRMGGNDLLELERLGVKLLDYLNGITDPGTAYLASISRDVQADDPLFDELVRALVPLEAGDKYTFPTLLPEPIDVLVLFFADVPEAEAESVLEAAGLTAELFSAPSLWETTASQAEIEALAADDRVQWIEEGPTPFMPALDDVRAACQVDAVQQLDTATGVYQGLTGAGVQIAIMDSGVDDHHNDFAGRMIRTSHAGNPHGTHVASIAAGSGVQSDQNDDAGHPNGGTPFQWRGMAPQAGIAAYGGAGGNAGVYSDAINNFGVDVSNHSYVLQVQGLYDAEVASVDSIVRGDSPGVPARPVVWAAANNADQGPRATNGDTIPECVRPQYPGGCPTAYQVGYFSVLGPCKNCISVASVNKNTLIHTSFSSMGPTMDGRLKPDVASIGLDVKAVRADVDWDGNPVTGNGYVPMSGTSMASPAVAGIVALLLQQYAQTFGVNLDVAPPLPSTIKAILIQTAIDLAGTDPYVNPDTGAQVRYGDGPDWATGYGLVDAEAAVQLVQDRDFIEDSVAVTDATDEYPVAVVPGQAEVRVTLAWDDIAGTQNSDAAAPQLVNDLDLILIEPDGTVHRPLVLPLLTPNDCDGDASNGVQVGTCAGLDPAGQNYFGPAAEGTDRRNNVEQVVVQDPTPGTWKVRVSVLNQDGVTVRLPQGGVQTYSLAGVTNERADVSIFKLDQPDPVNAGEQLYYSIGVFNGGPDSATNVRVVDTLPAGVTYVTDTDACTQGPPGTLTCTVGNLAPFESREFTIKVAVSPDLVAGAGGPTSITNRAEVFSSIPDDNPANNIAIASTIVEDLADLKVTKLCKPDDQLLAGETATCTIYVDNLGPSTAREVILSDIYVSDGTFTIGTITSSQGWCALAPGNVVNCVLGNLAAPSPSTWRFHIPPEPPGYPVARAKVTIEITATEAMDINDVATVVSDTPDPDTSNNQAQDSIPVTAVADLSLTKADSPDPVVAGTNLTYNLVVTNTGPSTAVNVVVEDVLPVEVDIASVTSSSGTCNAGVPGNPFLPTTCTFDTVPSGGSRTMAIVARVKPDAVTDVVTDQAVIHNDARASSDVFDPDNGDNLASADTTIQARADLSLTKAAIGERVAGQDIRYEYQVGNQGPSVSRDVTLRDFLPAGMEFLGAFVDVEGGTGGVPLPCAVPAGSNTLFCPLGDIPPTDGVPIVVFVDVHIKANVAEGTALTNSADLLADTPDPVLGNNTASVPVTVVTRADLTVVKTADADTYKSSSVVIYTVTVVNNGPSDAQGVVVTDVLPIKKQDRLFWAPYNACTKPAGSTTLTCNLGTIAAGGSKVVKVAVQLKGNRGIVSNTANVSVSTSDPDLTNNSSTVVVNMGSLPKP